MRPRVYIETTIPSYLTAWPSRDPTRAVDQLFTREWWDQRAAFDLYVSQLVLNECAAGDPTAAADRLAAVVGLPLVGATPASDALADELLGTCALPPKATADATHIALAATNGLDYLVTWNCTHIANTTLLPQIAAVCRAAGFEPPVICTPRQLTASTEGSP